MALMMDNKPKKYKGEAVVWDKISDFLPNDVVVYNHREIIDDREFDFALLIKNVGILVVEVKGWQAKYIFDVKSPDEIIMERDTKVYCSPEKQARGYRFDWLNFLQDQFGISPVVLSMVCYPFISEWEYKSKRLDLVSSKDFTIFAEDLTSADKLGRKISNAFMRKKPLNSTPFDDGAMSMVRQYFEPSFMARDEEVFEIADAYSILKIYNHVLSTDDIAEILNTYFAGTKVISFVRDDNELNRLAVAITKEFRKRGIVADEGKIRLACANEFPKNISCHSGSLRIFNFEAYSYNSEIEVQEEISVAEGQTSALQEVVLEEIAKLTGFNLEQYKIEHANGNCNILVQAGAGTGKTYSMVSRIAYLCLSRRCFVNNIVDEIAMVTFTNEAADSMKVRLKQYFMNCYVLTRKKKILHEIEAVDLMQISTIHKFAKVVLQSVAMEYGLGAEFGISSSKYAKEQVYEKYLNSFIVKRQQSEPNFAQQLKMPVHKFRKLLMNFSQQLYNKSYGVTGLKPENLGTFEEWPFFNDVIMEVMIPAETEYEREILSKNKIDLKESMLLFNEVVNGPLKKKCGLKYKYLFIDEFQDTDDVQIDSFLKLQAAIKSTKLFVVGDLKQSIYRFRGATISAFELIEREDQLWETYSLTRNYRTDSRLLQKLNNIFTQMGTRGFLPFVQGKDSLDSNIDAYLPDYDLITKIEYKNAEERMNLLFAEIDRQKELIKLLDANHKLSNEEKIIAILVRDNWQIHNILEEAKIRGQYIETQVGGDLYQLTPALDLYKLVIALLNPGDPVSLFNLVGSNYIGIELDIQGLHGKEKTEQTRKLTEVLDQYFEQIFDKSWSEIVEDTRILPILMLLRDIYEKTQPWFRYSEIENEQKFYMANYELVLEKIIKTYSVDYLTLNVIENSLHINILARQEELARNVQAETDDIRIICTTVHKSKGLEYGTVIMPYMEWDIASMKKADLDVYVEQGKLAYAIRIGKDANKKYNSNYDVSQEQTERVNEECRVLYVALTRAIRNIVWMKDIKSKSRIAWQDLMEV
ncbi:MAG: UvrD-helicase domain-containing protein [Lachnospiraceae bacterium]|jgi:DNA helicase-2/ATP-dependent DNA helicase PcrA|nr:UvrD-helicase domain-containing protein [Lachnospiraceae bacterium]